METRGATAAACGNLSVMIGKQGAFGAAFTLMVTLPALAFAQSDATPPGTAVPGTYASPSAPDAATPASPPARDAEPTPVPRPTPYTAPNFAPQNFVPAVVTTSAAQTPLPNPPGAIVPGEPGAAWSAGDVAALRRDVDGLLAGAPALRGAHVGVYAIDSTNGTVLYRSNAGDEFQPASTTKLVVGSAALDRLGPNYRWKTSLDSLSDDDAPTLLLRGGGDPLLASSDLHAAAAAAKAAGIRGVSSVVVDDTKYVSPRYPDGWVWDDFGQDYAARPSAATVEENVVHLHLRPGDDVGAPAIVEAESGVRVDAEPGDDCVDAFTSSNLTVHASVTTGASGADRDVDVALDRGGCPSVFGTMPLGSSMHSIDVSVESPAIYAHAALMYELSRAGVAAPAPDVVAFPHRYGERSIRALRSRIVSSIWEHESSPLAAILGPDLWIPSDNFVAEMLLDEIGFAAGGAPGSTSKGLSYERKWLQSIGVDLATVTLADGSGLSQYDRLTPTDLVAILQHDWSDHRDIVLRSLPIGGMRGTIESLTGTPLTGRIFAKTGNMSHVHGLAGFLSTQHHGAVTFAFLVDDCNPPYADVSALRARVLSRIVTAE